MADGSLFLKLDSSSFYVLDMASMYRDLYHFAVNLVEEADKATKDRYYLWRGEIVPENVKDQLAKDLSFQNPSLRIYTTHCPPLPEARLRRIY